ncbi:MAG: hypothetical protein KC502_16065, partial [Myxococcales bacterium]|nr:hypothetical protein [Myxococcales bacterium]
MLPGLASVAGVAAGRFEARRPGAFLAGVLGFVGVLCAAVMCFAATPQPHSRTIKLHVVGALAGQLGLGDCREPAPPQHDLARLAQLSRAPADATVLFGGMLGHGVDGRYVAQRSPHALAQLLSTLNPTVAGLAAGELAQRPTSLLRWAQAMEAHGIAVVASNLTCRHQRAGLCATVARQHMGPAEVGGGRVGVISLVTDDLAVHVEPAFLVGTGMAPAVQVARQQARKLRNSGVAVVVAMVHQGRRRHSERKLMKLAEGLRGDVHVILTDGLGAARDSDRVIRVGHGSTAVHIVAIAPGALNEVALRVRGQAGGRARVVASVRGRLPTASTPRDPVTAAAMARLRETYCRDWGTPLIANQDGTALTRAALIHLALGVMRRDAAADVAMLHAGALSRAGPWPRGVSRADLGAVFATPHR